MTVTATTVVSDPLYPNGVNKVFPFSFEVVDEWEVGATLDGVALDPALYTVTLDDNGSGSVTFFTAPAGDGATNVLLLYSDPRWTQGASLKNQGPYFQAAIETVLDRLAIRLLWLRDRVSRSLRVPVGETLGELPSLAQRIGKYFAFDAGGNPIASSGTGNDPNLRTDLATQPEIIGAPSLDGSTLKDYLLGWLRKNTAQETETLADDIAIATGNGYIGNGLALDAAPGFSDSTIFTLAANSELGGVVVDGSNVAGPAAGWGAGRQKGGAGFATGTNSGNRISFITYSGRFADFANGAFNFEYVDHVRSPGATFLGNQTAYPGFVTCADLTGYYGRYWDIGVQVNIGYGLKAHNVSYMEKCHFDGFITEGGTSGFAANQWTAGQHVHVGFSIHDGISGGYGEKLAGVRNLHHGPVIAINAQEAVQIYGAMARYGNIDSEGHYAAALMCDAYQSRDQINNSEVDFACNELRAIGRAYTSGTSQNGLTVRGDNTRLSRFTGDGATTVFAVGTSPSSFPWSVVTPANLAAYVDGVLQVGGAIGNGIQSTAGNNVTLNAAPANGTQVVIVDLARTARTSNIDIGLLDVANGYSGLYEVRTPMSWIDRIRVGHMRARNLAAGGYLGFFKARDVDIMGGDYDPSVRQGFIIYTDAMNRGGTLRVKNQKLKGSTSWTSEPFMRLGYSGTGDFSECGFEHIEFSDWMLNGNGDATFKAISIHGHRANTIRRLVLRDIYVTNAPLAEQIYIDLSGHPVGSVILDILNVHIFSSTGVPAQININDPNGAVVGGSIQTSCTFTGTGRPVACWPKVTANTQNLGALAAGATSAVLTAAVAGLAAGDKVEVVAENVKVSVPDYWVDSAGNVGFIVTNRTAGVLGAAEPFRITHHRKGMV